MGSTQKAAAVVYDPLKVHDQEHYDHPLFLQLLHADDDLQLCERMSPMLHHPAAAPSYCSLLLQLVPENCCWKAATAPPRLSSSAAEDHVVKTFDSTIPAAQKNTAPRPPKKSSP